MIAKQLVMCARQPAFCRGPNGRITAWNTPIERLLSRPAKYAIDRKCYRVLGGRDQIGTYCSERCPTLRLALDNLEIRPYLLDVKVKPGWRMTVDVSIVTCDDDDGLFLIHLLNPLGCARPVVPGYEDDIFETTGNSFRRHWRHGGVAQAGSRRREPSATSVATPSARRTARTAGPGSIP